MFFSGRYSKIALGIVAACASQALSAQAQSGATKSPRSAENFSTSQAEKEASPRQGTAHSPAAKALLQRYYDGAYREVAQEGQQLLEREPNNHELRFIVANSLAWTGSSREASAHYQALKNTPYHDRALLGWGNVQRWSGRPDRAAAAYREVLRNEPANKDAREGMLYANREVLPLTNLRIGRSSNSDDATRTWTTLSHQWRNDTGATLYGITGGYLEEEKNGLQVTQRDLVFSYEALDAPLAPHLEVSVQESPTTELFAALSLKVADAPSYITFGRVNWGKMAFDPRALQDGLTANQFGARTEFNNALGAFAAAYDYYRVSDDNVIQAANLVFTPTRQPFGTSALRAYTGVEARKARFASPFYWTPEEGHYNGLVGLRAEWSSLAWQAYGSLQYGFPLAEESGQSWSTGFTIQRWLKDEWVASADFWAIHTPREDGYRSNAAGIRIGKVW